MCLTGNRYGARSRARYAHRRASTGDISQPDPAFLIVILRGGSRFRSETVLAYELGYRGQLSSRVSAALSTFYNDYDDLRSTSTSPPDPLFGLPFPFFFENNLEGETYGFELSADVQLLDRWRLHAAYRLLQEDIRVKPGRTDFNNALNETSDPQQQISVRSSVELPQDVELNTALRWVDTRRINNVGLPAAVPDYMELDLSLNWHPTQTLELALVGQNLLHDHHPEYGSPGPARVEIERSIYGKVVWRY